MAMNKTLYQDIQRNLETCPPSRIVSSPSPPLCLDQERGRKRKDTNNKVVPNCLANFYIELQYIHADQCVQLMLAVSFTQQFLTELPNMACSHHFSFTFSRE